MNTLDSILPELRSLLPASLRGAYLDGYLQRRRTPMELLLSRSLPNVDVAASTFEDVRAEIRTLGLPLWVANRYLAEAEQALAIGHDTREVIAAAKAWLATKPENPPEADVSCHVCSETGKKSCTACGTEIIPYGAHGDSCPRCAEQEIDAINMPITSEAATPNRAVTIADQFERLFGLGERRPTSELLIPGKTEDLSGFSRSVVYWPKTFKRPHFTLVLRASSSSTPKQLLALGRKALAWFAKMRGRPASSPGGPETETIIAVEWMTSSVVVTKLAGGLGVIRMPGEEPRLSLLADAHDWRAAFAAEPGRNVAPETHDASAAPIDRFMAAYEPALYDALKEHPEEYAFTAAEVPTFLPQWRHALLTQDFNHHGYAIRGACKKLGIKCTKKALLAFLRPGATLPEPREVRSSAKRPSLPDPVLTRRSEVAFRSEADALADIFNEGATWQAEATNPNMVGKWHAPGVRLSIFSEARGPGNVVAIATIDDNDVDVEWLSAGLSEATRNEITRRLRTAALTQSEDSEAPSPLQDLIESTEKRALELGAKPARTRSFGRVTSDNADEKRLAEALRDLRDPTEIAESIKWLEDQDLGIGFNIDDRLSEMDTVSSLMEEIWTPILDTIGMEGVSTQNMRGRDRILSVATGAVFRDGAPFLLQRLVRQGRPTLRKVMIEIVEDSSDEDVTAFIDTEKVMTVGREQGSLGPMVHSSEQRGASFIGLLYQYMARLREDLERAPKVLSDVRRLLYWTGAMLDAPRCQDETKRRAMESFEAAKVLYDEARTRVTTQSTTSSGIASIKAPLRKAAVSAAQLATDCGEGQVDIFSARPHLPLPDRQASRNEPPPLPPEGPQTPLREQDPHSVDVLVEEPQQSPRPTPSQPADPAKIADRIRKLLALAERAGTPEEAGTAYATAQKLIAQHAISEEQLRQSRLGASTRSNEPIVSRIIYTSPVPQMPTWIGVLGMCLSEANGCEMAQSHGPNREVVLKAWGRASDLEIVEELLRVIPGQVDALCNRSSFSGRTAKNNFRIGAVTVICERMRAAVRDARRAIQEDTSEHSATTTALALASLDNRGALAKAQMRRDVPNLKMKSTRHRGDAASFEAGRAAGALIGLSRQRSLK